MYRGAGAESDTCARVGRVLSYTAYCKIETGVSGSSKRVSIFLYVCQGVKQANFYFDRETGTNHEGSGPAAWSKVLIKAEPWMIWL